MVDLETLECLEIWALLDDKERQDLSVSKDPKDQQEFKAIQDCLGTKVIREALALQDLMVRLAVKDYQDPKAKLA